MRVRVAASLALAACLGALAVGASPAAGASHPFLFSVSGFEPSPGVFEHFEDPCGLAVDSAGDFYVSDYYGDAIAVFSQFGRPITSATGIDPLDGPCGLAVTAAGDLYVNDYHQGVLELTPSSYPLASATKYSAPEEVLSTHATGIALDPATGNLLVDERTRVGEYELPVQPGDEPVRTIGAGAIEDGYGLAVSGYGETAGYVYVPDAAGETVKVFDPAASLSEPVATIDGEGTPRGRFNDLADAAVAVDDANGHLYVADNLQGPLYEHPQGAVEELTPAGDYLGSLEPGFLDAEPPGLAVDESSGSTAGRVYVTSGNSEEASVYAFGPAAAEGAALPGPPAASGGASVAAGGAPAAPSAPTAGAGALVPAASASEITQKGSLRVAVTGRLAPRRLPRHGTSPVSVSIGGKISTADGSKLPQLRALRIEFNRHGRLEYAGLPVCAVSRIQPASTVRALAACRGALVGRGSFHAEIVLRHQAPYPTTGRLLVFNGRRHGKQVLLGQIYAAKPFANSFVIVFGVQHRRHGEFGTVLTASLPEALGDWGYVTAIDLKLSRRYSYQGKRRSYLSAGCPAPQGFSGAIFDLARTSFAFAGGAKLTSTLTQSCKAR
jgi:DNA-binding beta-propeller fold protein YncE